MNSIKIMIFLWQIGVVDSLTLFQFCMNCGAQYGGLVVAEAAGSMNDIGPSVLLAPLAGLGTSYKYVRVAQGAMEKRARIATIASFLTMSGRDPATNGAAGGTIATFIGHIHMKSIIAKSNNNNTGGLVFASPVTLSKFTNDELIVINLIIVGGVSLIIISSYLLPRITKAYWNYSKKLSRYTITFCKKRIRKIKEFRKIRKQKHIAKLKKDQTVQSNLKKVKYFAWYLHLSVSVSQIKQNTRLAKFYQFAVY